MGVRDAVRQLFSAPTDTYDSLLQSFGIDAALAEYDPQSRQVVLAVSINGQARYLMFPTGRKFTRPELAALLASDSPVPAAAVPTPPASRPPGDSPPT